MFCFNQLFTGEKVLSSSRR
uniref:Uncharacterized protein n=1 Tax=Anguilla anguilla TaxID=7936 RepID=A0A0E9QRT7_ANGAN